MGEFKSKIERSIGKNKNVSYEPISFQYDAPYTYTPDFAVKKRNKTFFYVETKGGNSYRYFKSDYRKRWLVMRDQNKDCDFRFIFEKDFKLGKVMRCSDWCKKHNIKYHIGLSVPKEWLNE